MNNDSSREQEVAKVIQRNAVRKRRKQIVIYGILIVGIAALFYSFIAAGQKESYSPGPVHWHAKLEIFLCGEKTTLPQPEEEEKVHGETFLGANFMHLHANDERIHIEGTVHTPEQITLGNFMNMIGLHFKNEELLEYKNGESCPNGDPGKVHLFVNGQENTALTEYVIHDGEEYQLRFE